MNQQPTKPGLGTLYGVGVGPGNPDLLTLRAVNVLGKVPVICVPQAANRRDSLALSIVQEYIHPEQEILLAPFPTNDAEGAARVWENAAGLVVERLTAGQDVAFLTEGDPMLFSTFAYVLAGVEETCPEASIEIVPGVSSVMAAAASARVPLAAHGERLAILPAVYGIEDLAEATSRFDTVVLMKVSPNLVEAMKGLDELGLKGKTVYVRRASGKQERVVKDLDQLTEEDFDYFSLLIVKNQIKRDQIEKTRTQLR